MFSISMPLMGSGNEAVVVNPASTRPDELTHNHSSEEAVILQPHSGTYDSLMTSKELGSSTEILISLAFCSPYLWANRTPPSSEAKNIGSPQG